jgi:hypothetical protein
MFITFIAFLVIGTTVRSTRPPHLRPSEDERVLLWKQRNTWPPKWQPESPELRKVLEGRERLIMNITYSSERWENCMAIFKRL